MSNTFPKLHNAAWPGVVGKGPGTPEPIIELSTMIDLTTAACVGGARFDGIDLFLSAPHVDIDSTDDDLKRLADTLTAKGLAVGSLVAPVWSGCANWVCARRASSASTHRAVSPTGPKTPPAIRG